jgi:tRNA-specific 2-thiouridylase
MSIAILTSGGVDSSVSLALLKHSGVPVTAFYLKIWLEYEVQHIGDCAWEEDISFVEKTCKQLDVPLRILSLQQEYQKAIVKEVISEIQKGNTPNPDIWCNERIKFGSFYQKIPQRFHKVATGHYAQVEEKEGKFFLKTAPDGIKDQTYFLSRLTQKQLSRAIFPIGHFKKSDVRDLAKKFELPSSSRPDSQGICFLGKFKFLHFLREHLSEKQGDIVEKETGRILGIHPGSWFFTIGQRQGLGLSGGPWYVTKKNTEKNQVFVSRNIPQKSGCKTFNIINCNWIPSQPQPGEYSLKLRHGETFQKGTIEHKNETHSTIQLETPDRGIAIGQSAVLYKNGYCLGGGIISQKQEL